MNILKIEDEKDKDNTEHTKGKFKYHSLSEKIELNMEQIVKCGNWTLVPNSIAYYQSRNAFIKLSVEEDFRRPIKFLMNLEHYTKYLHRSDEKEKSQMLLDLVRIYTNWVEINYQPEEFIKLPLLGDPVS